MTREMNTFHRGRGICLASVAVILVAAAAPAAGQVGGPFDLSWHTLGGGGASAGGTYNLGGTMGQPDVGAISGGTYGLSGGLWVIPKMTGDTDGDADVDVFDVIDTINAFGSVPGDPNWNPGADFDGNGIVDVFDVIDCINNFGTSA